MIKRIWNWLFPCPLEQFKAQDKLEKERIRKIRESITPEMHAAAARIVAMHEEENRRNGGSSSCRSSSNSSGSRSDSSCTRFDD